MRYTYHWVDGSYVYKKTVRSFRGQILFKVQRRDWTEDEKKFHDFSMWKYENYDHEFSENGCWAIANAKDLDLGIWGV